MPVATESLEQTETLDPAMPAWAREILYSAADRTREESDLSRIVPESPFPYALPVDAVEVARRSRAPADQLRKGVEMIERGLVIKGKRQVCCGVFGDRLYCSNTDCGRRYYRSFPCRNRYCLRCGPLIYNALYTKYAVLIGAMDEQVRVTRAAGSWDKFVASKMDITTVNLRRMPFPSEVRLFNSLIKRFFRLFARALKVKPRDIGLLYCDEFGHKNSNLHAHGVYVGPWIPRSWLGKGGLLSRLWERCCRGTVFEGSRIVSVKQADGFGRGLGHALKYAGKFLDDDPVRLAILEETFHRVRRVHALGFLYRQLRDAAKKAAANPKETDAGLNCPVCGSAVLRDKVLAPVVLLQREGRQDYDEARRQSHRDRCFARDGPSVT
jgi:hypothetical protein